MMMNSLVCLQMLVLAVNSFREMLRGEVLRQGALPRHATLT